MGLTMQPSLPALDIVGKALVEKRDLIVADWVEWICRRVGADSQSSPGIEQQFALLVDILVEMSGPLRRPVTELWYTACESHGRASAWRGLAAGEVVEELQRLRELLIRHLAEVTAALPARQYLATVVRLNRFVDKGISHAVVGYTDSLIETLFNQSGVPISAGGGKYANGELSERLRVFEAELAEIRKMAAG